MMTERANSPDDAGGNPPCWAHLVDDPRAGSSDAALAHLMRNLADAVVICDREGTITFWNLAAKHLFGWSAGEMLGASLDVIIPERFRARHWAGYRRVIATGHTEYATKVLEVPTTHRDGTTMSLAFTVSLLTDPAVRGCTGIAAVIRDDTEAWQSRRALCAEITELRSAQTP